nr:ribosomal protein L16 [Thurnia sphaerocephala]
MEKHLVMSFNRKSIMLLPKSLLDTEFQVSKCGSLIVKKRHVLHPKRTKYPKSSKCRCSRARKNEGTELSFGRYGTKSYRPGRLSYRAIEAARRATIAQFQRNLNTPSRRHGKIWVRVLPDLPITQKPTEVRMGRGKGNHTGWIARVYTGQIPFEFDGLPFNQARQAARLAAQKLPSKTKFIQYQ